MESDEDNGKDSISDLINEVAGEVAGPSGEGPEEDGDNSAGEAKRRWKKSWILSGGVITFILSVLMFLLLPADNKKRVVKLAPKAEEAAVINLPENDDGPPDGSFERIDYELEPFFIPIEGGKSFLRLKLLLIGLMDGMDRKIKMSPHKYRAAVLNVFSGKEVREIEGRRGMEMLKDEIESRFRNIGGDEMMGKVIFTSYALTK